LQIAEIGASTYTCKLSTTSANAVAAKLFAFSVVQTHRLGDTAALSRRPCRATCFEGFHKFACEIWFAKKTARANNCKTPAAGYARETHAMARLTT